MRTSRLALVRRGQDPIAPTVRVSYRGHVFDASGYGSAARAYIHALHCAGVMVSVIDVSAHEPQVRDDLVESLLDRDIRPDFELFHGIPADWARHAFKVPNAIGMTVWETDTMPTQWQSALTRVLDIWLPCDFNVSVFQAHVSKPIFKLPHPINSVRHEQRTSEKLLNLDDRDFVFYSIFEWQERKYPVGQLIAYLNAFPNDGPHVLLLKCDQRALHAAQRAMEQARNLTRSLARVQIHCGSWNDGEIEALHDRGDCYVSLHRGEGWCYPLFEAACRGTPVVATAYSGPLEYLDPAAHQLVSYTLTNVTQPYPYYHPRMRWAEPDVAEASERLRWVYENREIAMESARKAAPSLRRRYRPEVVGEKAKKRLLELLTENHIQSPKTYHVPDRSSIPEAIPGRWYDADYFEHGLKSNWQDGYSWEAFEGLFRDTVAFLTTMFPNAGSFLDAGCAKGFLVRILREQGKEAWGFDASPWAIAHASKDAQPFVRIASAESVDWDREFDLTIAFDLFSHLTEEQITRFLFNARGWTKSGLLATIPTRPEEDLHTVCGNDPSHITLKSRSWWNDRFLETGWRRDGLHQALEGACQRHPLPSTMGWELFLYAPS